MRKFILISIITCCVLGVNAQNYTPKAIKYFNDSSYNGKVHVSQDASIKSLMESYCGINNERDGFPGYRVKVFAQNKQDSRSQANAIKNECSKDKIEAYITFIEPNFEVHVGNYTTRFEALALLKKLRAKYPNAYIVKTIITYPKH